MTVPVCPADVRAMTEEQIAAYLADSLIGTQPLFAVIRVGGNRFILGRDGKRWSVTVEAQPVGICGVCKTPHMRCSRQDWRGQDGHLYMV
jgi:hypothetical protein